MQLKEKHPAAVHDLSFPPEPEVVDFFTITTKEAINVVRSFPSGFGGQAGWISIATRKPALWNSNTKLTPKEPSRLFGTVRQPYSL